MYLHLPSICLQRPLSVPRTLPHPLQIRFQRRHTPRGEKPREQWGFRAETRTTAGDNEPRLLVMSLLPAPQQQNMVQVYKKQAWLLKEKITSCLSLLEFNQYTKSNRLGTPTVERASSLPISILCQGHHLLHESNWQYNFKLGQADTILQPISLQTWAVSNVAFLNLHLMHPNIQLSDEPLRNIKLEK